MYVHVYKCTYVCACVWLSFGPNVMVLRICMSSYTTALSKPYACVHRTHTHTQMVCMNMRMSTRVNSWPRSIGYSQVRRRHCAQAARSVLGNCPVARWPQDYGWSVGNSRRYQSQAQAGALAGLWMQRESSSSIRTLFSAYLYTVKSSTCMHTCVPAFISIHVCVYIHNKLTMRTRKTGAICWPSIRRAACARVFQEPRDCGWCVCHALQKEWYLSIFVCICMYVCVCT